MTVYCLHKGGMVNPLKLTTMRLGPCRRSGASRLSRPSSSWSERVNLIVTTQALSSLGIFS
jgi:hypothetical protein